MAMLSGKWALVTGATAGLGLAVAESLAAAGANLVLHDLVAPAEAADRLKSRFGVDAISIAVDLSKRAAIEAMMSDLLARLGGVDILINNAVVRHFAPVEDFSPEKWDEALAVTVRAVPSRASGAAGHEAAQLWPHHQHGLDLFDACRRRADRLRHHQTAIIGMTRAIAVELAETNITCNALCPGTLPTPPFNRRLRLQLPGMAIPWTSPRGKSGVASA